MTVETQATDTALSIERAKSAADLKAVSDQLSVAQVALTDAKAEIARLTAQPVPPPSVSANFTVKAGAVYRPDGAEFYGLGVNLFPTQAGDIADAVGTWKMNIIRCAAIPTKYNIDWRDADLDGFIETCAAKKVVCIADFHYAGDFFAGDDALADKIFGRLATKYAANPYLWFGTRNEYSGPGKITHTDGTRTFNDPSKYIQWTRDRITNIRAKGGKQPVVVGALSWAQDLADRVRPLPQVSSVLLFGDKFMAGFDNVMFDVHAYNDYSHSANTIKDFLDLARIAGKAVLIGETGVDNANEDCTPAQVKLFAAIAAGRKVLAIGWQGHGTDLNFFTTQKTLKVTFDASGKPTNLSPMGQRFWAARGYGR